MPTAHSILILCFYGLGIIAAALLGVRQGAGLDIAVAVAFGCLMHAVLTYGFLRRASPTQED